MDEWAFILIVALCIALAAYRIRRHTGASYPDGHSAFGGWWGPGPPWVRFIGETKES
jgi:hypothetical protein